MSRHPEVKWAELTDKVFLTIQLPDSKNTKVNLDPEGLFTFSANAGSEDHLYELKLELHDKVNVEASKINIGVRNVVCILEKAEEKRWNKLLRVGKPPHYVKIDWDKWVDEDEEKGTGTGDMDMGGMDFSSLGGMGGLGGMEGLGGMGGLGGMEGLGGLGGLGGMEGLGGMGGMDEFEDSDDEGEVAKPDVKSEETAEAAATGEAKHEGETKA